MATLMHRINALEHAAGAAVHRGIAEPQRRAADLLAQPWQPDSPEAEQKAGKRAGRLLAALLDHARKG